jgi:hypothetical protein
MAPGQGHPSDGHECMGAAEADRGGARHGLCAQVTVCVADLRVAAAAAAQGADANTRRQPRGAEGPRARRGAYRGRRPVLDPAQPHVLPGERPAGDLGSPLVSHQSTPTALSGTAASPARAHEGRRCCLLTWRAPVGSSRTSPTLFSCTRCAFRRRSFRQNSQKYLYRASTYIVKVVHK